MSILSRPSVSVLFVCRANICRSPMAEGLLREELKLSGLQRKVQVDSAGTHASQPGHPADGRAQRVCLRAGVDLRKSRARQMVEQDFKRFDYILAMDQSNASWLSQTCPRDDRDRISLLGNWVHGGSLGDIPDPYYGSVTGFEEVLQQIYTGVDSFLSHLEYELKG